jgi:hypothetical protein
VNGSGTVEKVDDPKPVPAETPRPGPVAWLLLRAVRFYQVWISPVLPPSCRFEPSCSAYAVEALTVHGALRGTWLTVRRLLRCGPWHPGGWDPVPPGRRAPAGSSAQRTRNRPAELGISNPARSTAAEE